MGPKDKGLEYRRRAVEVLEGHGGELKTTPDQHQYGVSGILRDEVGYEASATSWNTMLRRMVKEGIIEVVDRDAKRIWHIRLSPERPYFLDDENDEDDEVNLADFEFLGTVDYEKLAWAVMGAAAEAIAKPGRRLVRYKERVRQLLNDNIALTARLEDERAANAQLRAQVAAFEKAERHAKKPAVVDAHSRELGFERGKTRKARR